ncbi:MAG: ATP synthase F1 subunit epsilon [Aliifodinibius sp.]|nr:ATP synthase F1 subunit epsilon [Candidatus Bathyarchaeota archaeon]NIT56537.1 ATP synthase F1 subunit epsilon [Fodinibius sp.]NIV12834.1 ATP synthase F1 subunit epsilon [Fodinibius sp.]NIY25120.1 ATP synthase F1 subunit epsilon [Fodinibius sp.]
MNTFSAQILTPEGSIFDDEVTGVRVPGEMGSFEVKTLHANIISSLEIGEILVRKAAGGEQSFSVTGGFVEVIDNKLTLLAEAAEPVEEIDVERAKQAKERAVERLESDDKQIDKDRARKALKRAENRIKLSVDIGVNTQ